MIHIFNAVHVPRELAFGQAFSVSPFFPGIIIIIIIREKPIIILKVF